jgi:hypothetical protein
MYALLLIVISLAVPQQNETHNPLTKSNRTKNPSTQSQKQESNSDNDRICTNCEINGQPSKTQKETDDETFDRRFQRVYWGITIVGVFGGLVLLCIVWKQGQAIVNAERAWLMVDLTNTPLYPFAYKQGTKHADFTLICRNDGSTPCWIDEVRAGLTIVDRSAMLPDVESATIKQFTGPMPVGVGKDSEPIRCHLDIEDSPDLGQHVVIYGLVKYRHPFARKLATTTFAYISEGDSWRRKYGQPKYNNHT